MSWGEGMVGQVGEWLRGSARPLVVDRDHGSWVLAFCTLRFMTCPSCAGKRLVSVPQFLCICCLKR